MKYLSFSYCVKTGDNLTKIGLKFGYKNPGPIFAFPYNLKYFKKRTPNKIKSRDTIRIPWHPNHLESAIQTRNELIKGVKKDINNLINEKIKDKKSIESFLFKIDAINFLANVFVGIGAIASKGFTGTSIASEEALCWLVESRVANFSNVISMAAPPIIKRKRDFKFYVRHALGPWNSSYWATVAAAIEEKDLDRYLYGNDFVHQREVGKIINNAKKDIDYFNKEIMKFKFQKSMPFYNKII